MTTSQLIEMLKKADPSGIAHIRTPDGIPYFVDLVEGIVDSPYSYIDNDGNYVYSSVGMKVDLYSIDVWGFVEKNYSDGVTWEDILKKFKFDLTYKNKDESDIRMNALLSRAKDAFDSIQTIHNNANNIDSETMNTINNMIKKKKSGLVSKKNMKR